MKTIKLKSKEITPVMEQIKDHSRDGLVLCFAGVGSAWSKRNVNTSLIVAKNGITILVDIGRNIPDELDRMGVDMLDFDYYHFTHSHSDHIGGLEQLLLQLRYIKKKKAKVIITNEYQQVLWNETLKGGCEINEEGLLRFTDLVDVIRPDWVAAQPREEYHIKLNGVLESI